ncbi:hypothetical protein [uncultured Jatrophihabitans sp.]|uniref:hypothetical protein n=1 Tax=uncultured Jatrophihabitans sp. TaxID=1610747 RepID=UPI0035CA6575
MRTAGAADTRRLVTRTASHAFAAGSSLAQPGDKKRAEWCGGVDECRESTRMAEHPETRLPMPCPICGDPWSPKYRLVRPEPTLFEVP